MHRNGQRACLFYRTPETAEETQTRREDPAHAEAKTKDTGARAVLGELGDALAGKVVIDVTKPR
jgi:hypothetical protein